MAEREFSGALRETIADALWQAHRFVEAHGDAVQRARAAALLRFDPGAVAQREAALAARGAEARGAGERGAPHDPRTALALLAALAEIGRVRGSAAAAIAAWIASAQRPDGSFRAPGFELDPDPALPPFAGRDTDPLYLTGALGALLARSAAASWAVVDAAAAFLAPRFSPELLAGGPWHGLAAYGAFFANAPHDAADAILQWVGREWEKGFRTGGLAPLDAARLLVACDARGLPGASVDPRELAAALADARSADGGHGAGATPARVDATNDAIGALLHLLGAPR